MNIPAKGGAVVCTICDKSQVQLGEGIAMCSMSDVFSYEVGRSLAFQRARENVRGGIQSSIVKLLDAVDGLIEGGTEHNELL